MSATYNQRNNEFHDRLQTYSDENDPRQPPTTPNTSPSTVYANGDDESRGERRFMYPQGPRAHQMADRTDHFQNERSIALSRSDERHKGRRSPLLYDFPEAMAAEFGMLEAVRSPNWRGRILQEDSEGEDELENARQPGCLDALVPKLRRMFSGRRHGIGTPMRGFQSQGNQNPSETRSAERGTGSGETPTTRPRYGAQPIQRSGIGSQDDAHASIRFRGDPYAHAERGTGARTVVSRANGPGASLDSLQAANIIAAPAIFPEAHTGHISGGQFYVARSVTVIQHQHQHVYQMYPPNAPISASLPNQARP